VRDFDRAYDCIGSTTAVIGALALGPLTSVNDIGSVPGHFRCVPKPAVSKRSKQHSYSITSSARASSVGGTSRPRTFAVIKFTARSIFVGCSTGSSLGFAPRRILST
jgi:hypothetical protein